MIQIENADIRLERVRLERVGIAHTQSIEQLSRSIYYARKVGYGTEKTVDQVSRNEFRQRFAKSIAEMIVSDWEHLVFDEKYDISETEGTVTCSSFMYIVRKKDKKSE